MQLETYIFVKDPGKHYYEFYSEGPKGYVKKVVEYTRLDGLKTESYNLSFGDWDENSQRVNDKTTTNNEDRDKVLATVAATVIDFMQKRPNAFLFAQGSTPGRTRLYQMSINKLREEILNHFVVRRFVNNKWQYFEPGMNYTAFLLELK